MHSEYLGRQEILNKLANFEKALTTTLDSENTEKFEIQILGAAFILCL